MGITQGSVIALILLNILFHGLPIILSEYVEVVQYANDICIWVTATLKRKKSSRPVNCTKSCIKKNLTNRANSSLKMGLHLHPPPQKKNNNNKQTNKQKSQKKNHMMLFRSGYSAEKLYLPSRFQTLN